MSFPCRQKMRLYKFEKNKIEEDLIFYMKVFRWMYQSLNLFWKIAV